MSKFEKCMVSLTMLFLSLCMFLLISGLYEPKIIINGYKNETFFSDFPSEMSIREKLDIVLGIDSVNEGMEGRININTAEIADLCELPGIGETIAARIIKYRTYNGSFEKKEYIMDVTGIGEGIYAKIKDLICV